MRRGSRDRYLTAPGTRMCATNRQPSVPYLRRTRTWWPCTRGRPPIRANEESRDMRADAVSTKVWCCASKRGPSLESRLPYLSEPSFADDLFDLKVGQVDSIGVRLGLCVAHGGLVVGGRQSGVARASWITLFHKSTPIVRVWGRFVYALGWAPCSGACYPCGHVSDVHDGEWTPPLPSPSAFTPPIHLFPLTTTPPSFVPCPPKRPP